MTNCGLILESILQAASDFVSDAEEAIFMSRCFNFASKYAAQHHLRFGRKRSDTALRGCQALGLLRNTMATAAAFVIHQALDYGCIQA